MFVIFSETLTENTTFTQKESNKQKVKYLKNEIFLYINIH